MIQYRIYPAAEPSEVPSSKRFFCLPHFLLDDGHMTMTFFTYGATAEEAREKAETFWTAEIAKARQKYGNRKKDAKNKGGRPISTAVTAAMLAKIDDDFDPKG